MPSLSRRPEFKPVVFSRHPASSLLRAVDEKKKTRALLRWRARERDRWEYHTGTHLASLRVTLHDEGAPKCQLNHLSVRTRPLQARMARTLTRKIFCSRRMGIAKERAREAPSPLPRARETLECLFCIPPWRRWAATGRGFWGGSNGRSRRVNTLRGGDRSRHAECPCKACDQITQPGARCWPSHACHGKPGAGPKSREPASTPARASSSFCKRPSVVRRATPHCAHGARRPDLTVGASQMSAVVVAQP